MMETLLTVMAVILRAMFKHTTYALEVARQILQFARLM
jgi:hypothetical protein